MDNFVCMKRSESLINLSKSLGFENIIFEEEDFFIVSDSLLQKVMQTSSQLRSRKKTVFVRPVSEEMLRQVLEKGDADGVIGVESLHSKESLHYVRGGLDDVLCTIAARRGKKVVFSFSELLHSNTRARVLMRMRANIKLCQKYRVEMVFSTFAGQKEDFRSCADLGVFFSLLGVRRNATILK